MSEFKDCPNMLTEEVLGYMADRTISNEKIGSVIRALVMPSRFKAPKDLAMIVRLLSIGMNKAQEKRIEKRENTRKRVAEYYARKRKNITQSNALEVLLTQPNTDITQSNVLENDANAPVQYSTGQYSTVQYSTDNTPIAPKGAEPPMVTADDVMGGGYVSTGESAEIAKIMIKRHPKKGDPDSVIRALNGILKKNGAAAWTQISRVHQLWCRSDEWTRDDGKYCPKLSTWLRDGGWRVEPEEPVVEREVEHNCKIEIV